MKNVPLSKICLSIFWVTCIPFQIGCNSGSEVKPDHRVSGEVKDSLNHANNSTANTDSLAVVQSSSSSTSESSVSSPNSSASIYPEPICTATTCLTGTKLVAYSPNSSLNVDVNVMGMTLAGCYI